MRVLLVQSWLGRPEPPVLPLGLLNLGAAMPDADVSLYDPNLSSRPMEELKEVAARTSPNLICVSLRNCDTTKLHDPYNYLPAFAAQVRILRRTCPQARLLAGGSGFSLFARQILEYLPELDAGVTGKAEVTMARLEEAVGSSRTPVTGRGRFIRPRYDLTDLRPYVRRERNLAMGVEVARGCSRRCSYCTYPGLDGEESWRDTGAVLDDIEALYAAGARHLFLVAPVLNSRPAALEGLLREMVGSFPGLTWEGYHTPEPITTEYLRLARSSGLVRVGLSPDGTTDRELRELGKGFSMEALHRAIEAIRLTDGVGVSLSFFSALPGASLPQSLAALLRAYRLGRSCGDSLRRLRATMIRMIPGTPLAAGLGLTAEELFVPDDRLPPSVFCADGPAIRLAVRHLSGLVSRGLR